METFIKAFLVFYDKVLVVNVKGKSVFIDALRFYFYILYNSEHLKYKLNVQIAYVLPFKSLNTGKYIFKDMNS